MCRDVTHLSDDEEKEAEDSLAAYCKPVELYNILQRRALRNPTFLQRCLNYKRQVKKRRLQLMVSLMNTDAQARCLFPLYILLARRVPDNNDTEPSAVYRFSRASILANSSEDDESDCAKVTFLLPDFHKLSQEVKSRSLVLLVASFAGAQSSSYNTDLTRGLLENAGGCCLVGYVLFESLYNLWEKSPNFTLGQKMELNLSVKLSSCFLKLNCYKENKCVFIQHPPEREKTVSPSLVSMSIAAEEVGNKEKSPYHLYSCNGESPSFPNIMRLREGNVIFNYRYYNNKMQKTEVTEDFSCPFCLLKCASFKGLRYHLSSSHDLFNFEFWVTEEFQAVNISVKNDVWRSEIVADGVDPKQQTFYFCSKTRSNNQTKKARSVKYPIPQIFQSSEQPDKNDAQTSPEEENPSILPFSKTKKVSIDRNRNLLHKRQFFHSHRAQPMEMYDVLSDHDSEDEVDDDVADLEDRRMLDDFVDVTREEKQIMHWWNCFVRKQRVLADGHIPWACEAFTNLHGQELLGTPMLSWCWRLFMVKLWNHGLLDARTINNCNIALQNMAASTAPLST